MARSEDIKGPKARLAFTDGLFTLQTTKSGKKQWNVTLLYPKGTDLSVLEKAAADAAIAEWGEKAVQWIKDGVIKSPFLDGDGKQGLSKKTGERHAGYEGHKFIRCISGEDYRPKIVDRKKMPITDRDECYSGCYAFPVVNVFTWKNDEQGMGLSFGISALQVVEKGERLGGGGGVDTDSVFEALPDEGEAPAETKTGAGAAGMFG